MMRRESRINALAEEARSSAVRALGAWDPAAESASGRCPPPPGVGCRRGVPGATTGGATAGERREALDPHQASGRRPFRHRSPAPHLAASWRRASRSYRGRTGMMHHGSGGRSKSTAFRRRRPAGSAAWGTIHRRDAGTWKASASSPRVGSPSCQPSTNFSGAGGFARSPSGIPAAQR
jgi:hypothetical protein